MKRTVAQASLLARMSPLPEPFKFLFDVEVTDDHYP
jgi:hypothetical protein